jgi:hypothetical protein
MCPLLFLKKMPFQPDMAEKATAFHVLIFKDTPDYNSCQINLSARNAGKQTTIKYSANNLRQNALSRHVSGVKRETI